MYMYLLQPGAGTIKPDIISSLITGGSDGGGGQTNESIMSSVTRIMPTRSGGSVRDELKNCKNCKALKIGNGDFKRV